MLAVALKWPAEASTPSFRPSSSTGAPTQQSADDEAQQQLSTSLSEALLFEHEDSLSDGENDTAAQQLDEDDACSDAASAHSLHFSFDDQPSVQTPATFQQWAGGSDDDQEASTGTGIMSTGDGSGSHAAATAAVSASPDFSPFRRVCGSAANNPIGGRAPARCLSSATEPPPTPYARWDGQLPVARMRAISADTEALNQAWGSDLSFARSCPRPIAAPVPGRLSSHSHKPSNDALDALFVPPHQLVSASNVVDDPDGGFAPGSVQNPGSMRPRGAQMSKLRAGVLRSTGYFEGYTEMGAHSGRIGTTCSGYL